MSTIDEVLSSALQLSQAERAALAHQLLLSLEPGHADADWESAWSAEIEARLARFESGSSQASDLLGAINSMRRALRQEERLA